MLKIGITGGIGSGKSMLSKLLVTMGHSVYDSDKESKYLCDTYLPLKKQLIETFGEEIYVDNILNRKLLANIIFNSPAKLEKVNAIIHPQVASHFISWTNNQQKSPIFLESAILFESGFYQLVDKKILVYAPHEVRLKRTLEREGEGQRANIEQRMKHQQPDEEKINKVDFVIYNDETQLILPQLTKILATLSLI